MGGAGGEPPRRQERQERVKKRTRPFGPERPSASSPCRTISHEAASRLRGLSSRGPRPQRASVAAASRAEIGRPFTPAHDLRRMMRAPTKTGLSSASAVREWTRTTREPTKTGLSSASAVREWTRKMREPTKDALFSGSAVREWTRKMRARTKTGLSSGSVRSPLAQWRTRGRGRCVSQRRRGSPLGQWRSPLAQWRTRGRGRCVSQRRRGSLLT